MRGKRAFGALVLVLLGTGVILLVTSSGVRRPLGRVTRLLWHDAFASPQSDPLHPLDVTTGIRRGDPVYLDAQADGLHPVAYVTAVEATGVRVRITPGESVPSDVRLERLSAPRSLGDALKMAVPPAVQEALQREIGATIRTLLQEAILPEVRRRLPAFLARVDPREDEEAKRVLNGVGTAVLAKIRPLGDQLAAHVASDVEERLDFLERVGLLWDLVRGDTKALGEQLLPVAAKSAKAWWEEHHNAVLTAVGEGIREKLPEVQAWMVDHVLPAARDEIAAPVLAVQGKRLERAAEQIMRRVSNAVIEVPGGGFRLRVRTVLRTRLLEKDEPLLLFGLDRG